MRNSGGAKVGPTSEDVEESNASAEPNDNSNNF